MLKGKINILFLIVVGFSSCTTTRYLKDQEILLKSNKINVSGLKNDESAYLLKEQLGSLFKQKPNRNFMLVFPREGLYFYSEKHKDKKSWLGKTIIKTIQRQSERPTILDTNLCKQTQTNFKNFLFNQGYFTSNVNYKIVQKSKKAKVIYSVHTGPRYIINDLRFKSEDSLIAKILNDHAESSIILPGSPMDNNLYQQEKARITDLLFNHGYVDFNPIYIEPLIADTINIKANVILNIRNPAGKSQHQKYFINQVSINPNYIPNKITNDTIIEFDSLSFKSNLEKDYVRHQLLANKIVLRPGLLASKTLLDNTYDHLSKLGTYRFISIESKLDSIQSNAINYNILLSPNKKWVFDFGVDLNYTSIKKTSKTLFGVSGFANLKNRNVFNRAISYSTKIEIGTEVNLLKLSDFNSINVHLSNEFSLPLFYDITKTWSLLKMLSSPFTNIKNKPDSRTNIKLGLDYENLVSLYDYKSINTSIEYDWQVKKRHRISLHTLGFFLYWPSTTSAFDTLLLENKFLEKSFKGRRLFTSFFLDNITYYYQSKLLKNKQHSVITNFNISGFETNLVNEIYKTISGKKVNFSLGEFEFSKFIKSDIDYRFYLNFPNKSKLAIRFAAGVVFPFGSSVEVPYIKQFYVGGPQSIRAWNIRELGPGSLNLSDPSVNKSQIFYASGDFKLETSIEYRFDMFWRVKGALFLDAGNVWLLPKSSTDDKSAILKSTFYKELAVGTGLGVRLDLTYFLFRVDYGFQLRNTYPGENGKYWLYGSENAVSFDKLISNSTIHLALDYPF